MVPCIILRKTGRYLALLLTSVKLAIINQADMKKREKCNFCAFLLIFFRLFRDSSGRKNGQKTKMRIFPRHYRHQSITFATYNKLAKLSHKLAINQTVSTISSYKSLNN